MSEKNQKIVAKPTQESIYRWTEQLENGERRWKENLAIAPLPHSSTRSQTRERSQEIMEKSVILRALGHKPEKISEYFNIPLTTVYSHLQKADKKAREEARKLSTQNAQNKLENTQKQLVEAQHKIVNLENSIHYATKNLQQEKTEKNTLIKRAQQAEKTKTDTEKQEKKIHEENLVLTQNLKETQQKLNELAPLQKTNTLLIKGINYYVITIATLQALYGIFLAWEQTRPLYEANTTPHPTGIANLTHTLLNLTTLHFIQTITNTIFTWIFT